MALSLIKDKVSDNTVELLENVDPICPYCGKTLDKKPAKKKKCEHCGKFIYVRTRPADRQKVLVTESERDRLDAQWASLQQSQQDELTKKMENMREWTYAAWKKGNTQRFQGAFSKETKEDVIRELREEGYVKGKFAEVDEEKESERLKDYTLPDYLWDKKAKEPLFVMATKGPVYEFDDTRKSGCAMLLFFFCVILTIILFLENWKF